MGRSWSQGPKDKKQESKSRREPGIIYFTAGRKPEMEEWGVGRRRAAMHWACL